MHTAFTWFEYGPNWQFDIWRNHFSKASLTANLNKDCLRSRQSKRHDQRRPLAILHDRILCTKSLGIASLELVAVFCPLESSLELAVLLSLGLVVKLIAVWSCALFRRKGIHCFPALITISCKRRGGVAIKRIVKESSSLSRKTL